jgi:DNA-binding MarR family transcriptional regulator
MERYFVSRADMIRALSQLLREASAQSLLYSQAVAARVGINSTDLECLEFLGRRGPMTAGALAEAAGLTTGAVTGVLDRLENAGLARRKSDPSDRRKVVIHAVAGAEAKIAPLFAPMEASILNALASFDEPELKTLLKFLDDAVTSSSVALRQLVESVPLPSAQAPAPRRLRPRRSRNASI